MKLKMARNSLFAVLLRSPWWISIGIVLIATMAARALLPEPYVPFGMLGAFPFLVVGLIAAWRQLRAPAPEQVERTLEALAAMSWRDFSELLERAYAKQGYQVERTSDSAVDLLLRKGGRTTLVVARRWKAGNHGVEPLKALARARSAQDASHGTYMALGGLGDAARRFAEAQGITILSGPSIAALVGKLPA